MPDSIYEFTFNKDGSIKINASKAGKGEQEILKDLGALANNAGGKLIVEKHNPGIVHRENAGEVIKIKK